MVVDAKGPVGLLIQTLIRIGAAIDKEFKIWIEAYLSSTDRHIERTLLAPHEPVAASSSMRTDEGSEDHRGIQ